MLKAIFVLYFCLEAFIGAVGLATAIEPAGKGEAMANEEQLDRLKQGVMVWNMWRKENIEAVGHLNQQDSIDLSQANLMGFDLAGAYLMRTNLSGAKLGGCHLEGAHIFNSNLKGAGLWGADLRNANLSETELAEADLGSANLSGAKLIFTNFWNTILRKADLSGADLSRNDLREVTFDRTILEGSDFSTSIFGNTIFSDVDLSEVKGLENATYATPSAISTSTFARSRGKIPEIFLKGCGLNDWEIEIVKLYNPELSNEEVNQILNTIRFLRT